MQYLNKKSGVNYLFKISRPRFWLYLSGPYLIGIGYYVDWLTLYSLFYFLIPANIFLYGINDLYDQDTDSINEKKNNKETKVITEYHKQLLVKVILISLLLTIPIFIFGSWQTRILLTTFLFLSYFYSAPPIRFKTRFLLDSFSNILYIIPGLIGYSIVANQLPPISIIIAASFWSFAMHLFSAIPDIIPDSKTNTKTTAVILGKNKSLLLNSLFWGVSALFLNSYLVLSFFSFIYFCIPLYLFIKKANYQLITKIYWYFPILNGLVGFGLYLIRIFSS